MATYDKILDLLAYADLIGMKGVKKDMDDETQPCKKQITAYWHYLNTVPDERIEQVKPKLQGKFFPSAPELKELIAGLRTVSDSPDAYTPLPENRQIEDPSQQPITAAEWRRRRAGEEPKCWKDEDGYMRANPAWMLQQIQKGKAKFSQNAASLEQIARDMGLIPEQPKSRSLEEAMQTLQNRPPEVQDKIKQLAEINKKIEMAEAWLESNQNLSHEVAKKAEERYSKLLAESVKLSEELENLGVCA